MDAPLITVIDHNFALQAQIDVYTSLLFNRKWQGVGDWQLVLPNTAKGADKLVRGNIILLGADGHRSGYVESIRAVEGDNGVMLTVTGKTLQGLAAQRITLPDNDAYNYGYDNVPPLINENINPTPVSAETILKTYADRHMVNPLDPKRKFPDLILAKDLKRGRKIVWSSRLETLSDVLRDVCEYCDVGWEIYVDLRSKKLVFDIIEGVDRSYGQSQNSRVIFSRGFDNILSCTYTDDISGYQNLAYAGGAGEGADRTILKVTQDETEPEGWERREIFLDCGALEILETDTTMSLEDEAKHRLKSYPHKETFTAPVADTDSFAYLKKWDLGDNVTVVSKGMGKRFDTHVTEISERYEPSGNGLDVTFGAPDADLGRVIRSIKNTPR